MGNKPLPAIRLLDARAFVDEGQRLVCVTDPTQIIDEQLILTEPGVFIASQLDGVSSAEEICVRFREFFEGAEIELAHVQEVVETLDGYGFLETESYDTMRSEIVAEFAATSTRPAYFAGRSYPEEPDELRAYIDALYSDPNGPGALADVERAGDPLPGAVIPHIDFARGGTVYSHAYAEMARHGRPDTVLLFGVAHMAEPVPLILTKKDFETPLGVLRTDVEAVDAIAAACRWDPFEFEFTHRAEHSLEFHAVMLAHLYGSDVRIVPVLCSMFGDDFATASPEDREAITSALDACKRYVEASGKRVSVIASADFSHVGPVFGDDFEVDESVLETIAERDEEDLGHLTNADAEAWYASVMKDANARRVCGINCVYATLKSLEGRVTSGDVLRRDTAPDPNGGVVSFASVALR